MKNMITLKGYENLKDKLMNLHSERKIVIEEMCEVKDNCLSTEDSSELNQYRMNLDNIEDHITRLNEALSSSRIIDVSMMRNDKVRFGHQVKIEDMDSGDEKTYTLVSIHESDPKNGHISILSPLGRSLVGMEVGDIIDFNSPNGDKEYEILSINNT